MHRVSTTGEATVSHQRVVFATQVSAETRLSELLAPTDLAKTSPPAALIRFSSSSSEGLWSFESCLASPVRCKLEVSILQTSPCYATCIRSKVTDKWEVIPLAVYSIAGLSPTFASTSDVSVITAVVAVVPTSGLSSCAHAGEHT